MKTKTTVATPLQLFKQWKKTQLAWEKSNEEQNTLMKMAHKSRTLGTTRITADGFVYEMIIKGGKYSWNVDFEVKKLGSVEEFANLIK
jgi:hypothetical protein